MTDDTANILIQRARIPLFPSFFSNLLTEMEFITGML